MIVVAPEPDLLHVAIAKHLSDGQRHLVPHVLVVSKPVTMKPKLVVEVGRPVDKAVPGPPGVLAPVQFEGIVSDTV